MLLCTPVPTIVFCDVTLFFPQDVNLFFVDLRQRGACCGKNYSPTEVVKLCSARLARTHKGMFLNAFMHGYTLAL